jgi:hypothetical protein
MIADTNPTYASIVLSNQICCDQTAAPEGGDACCSVILDSNADEDGSTAAEHVETTTVVVLEQVTLEAGPGTPDSYACSSCCLNGVSAKPAEAEVTAPNAGRSAANRKALKTEFVRIKHIDHVEVPSRRVNPRGLYAWLHSTFHLINHRYRTSWGTPVRLARPSRYGSFIHTSTPGYPGAPMIISSNSLFRGSGMPYQVDDALPHAMSGTGLSRVRIELRLPPPSLSIKTARVDSSRHCYAIKWN